jgi:hypothetical protein
MGVAVPAGDDDFLHGVLYELSAYDYETLCMSEGLRYPAPYYVDKVVTAVPYPTPADPVPATVSATVFALSGQAPKLREKGVYPSARYLRKIAAGQAAMGISADSITAKFVAEYPAARPVSKAVMLVTSLCIAGLFLLARARVFGRLVRDVIQPALLAAYGAGERAAVAGYRAREVAWNVVLLTAMLPFALLGVLNVRRTVRMLQRISQHPSAARNT